MRTSFSKDYAKNKKPNNLPFPGIVPNISIIVKILIDKLQEIFGIKNTRKNRDGLELTFTKDIINSANKKHFIGVLKHQKIKLNNQKKRIFTYKL
jgi:hypothetical protein